MMDPLISTCAEGGKGPTLDKDRERRLRISVYDRVQDPKEAEGILKRVTYELSRINLPEIRFMDEFLEILVKRAIVGQTRSRARLRTGLPQSTKPFSEFDMVAHWLPTLSLIISGATSVCVLTWRLLEPLRAQLGLVLVVLVSVIALIVGGTVGVFAARKGAAR